MTKQCYSVCVASCEGCKDAPVCPGVGGTLRPGGDGGDGGDGLAGWLLEAHHVVLAGRSLCGGERAPRCTLLHHSHRRRVVVYM